MTNNRTLLIGGSSNIGKVIIDSNNSFDFTFYKNKIKNGVYFNILERNLSKIINLDQYSNIIILSAITKPDDCIENKELSQNINVDSTKQLIDSVNRKNIHIIFFSSEFVYDGLKGNYNEKDSTNPVNLYGKQKVEVENYIKSTSSKYTILRIAKTYSISKDDDTLLSKWFRMIFKDKDTTINCFNDQIFSPLYINDIPLIINNIIKNKIYGILNIGGPEILSRKECLEIFLETFNLTNKIKINETKLSEILSKDNWPTNVSFDITASNKLVNLKLTKLSEACLKMKKTRDV